MQNNCNNFSITADFTPDPCNGKRYKASCVISEIGFSQLDIAPNTNIQNTLQAMYLALISAKERIEELEERVEQLENP